MSSKSYQNVSNVIINFNAELSFKLYLSEMCTSVKCVSHILTTFIEKNFNSSYFIYFSSVSFKKKFYLLICQKAEVWHQDIRDA